MPKAFEVGTARVLVIINAQSGHALPDDVCRAVGGVVSKCGRDVEVYEAREGEDLLETTRRAVGRGFDLIVAAGGDGTVSAVANGLVGSEACLGIIPLGTTNVLARELGIPLDLQGACELMSGPNKTRRIDAMKVGEKYYFTQIGIGVDALMIRDTKTEHKKALGSLAYVWTACARLAGFQSQRFTLAADSRRVRSRSLDVVLANCGTLGSSGLSWGPDVRADDGKVDVCILHAQTLLGYLSVGCSVLLGRHRSNRNIQYLTVERSVSIHSDRPLPVQGDGEILGETPVEVEVVPGAVCVAVPAD